MMKYIVCVALLSCAWAATLDTINIADFHKILQTEIQTLVQNMNTLMRTITEESGNKSALFQTTWSKVQQNLGKVNDKLSAFSNDGNFYSADFRDNFRELLITIKKETNILAELQVNEDSDIYNYVTQAHAIVDQIHINIKNKVAEAPSHDSNGASSSTI